MKAQYYKYYLVRRVAHFSNFWIEEPLKMLWMLVNEHGYLNELKTNQPEKGVEKYESGSFRMNLSTDCWYFLTPCWCKKNRETKLTKTAEPQSKEQSWMVA